MRWFGRQRVRELTDSVRRLEAIAEATRQENSDLRERLDALDGWQREAAQDRAAADARIDQLERGLEDIVQQAGEAARTSRRLDVEVRKLDLRLTDHQQELVKIATNLTERVARS